MGRLYPRMRERPPEVRLNHASPLAGELEFLGVFTPAGGPVLRDLSAHKWNGRYEGDFADQLFVWDDRLKRFVANFQSGSINYFRFQNSSRWWFDGKSFSVMTWAWHRQLKTPFYTRQFNYHIPNPPYTGWTLQKTDGGAYHFFLSSGSGRHAQIHAGAIPAMTWHHSCGVFRRSSFGELWINGILAKTANVSAISSMSHGYAPCIGNHDRGTAGDNWDGFLADIALFSRALVGAEIAALADPSNVDLRVGGVPLILPPRRRFWPVVSEQAIPKMVPWHLFQQVSA